MTRWSFLVLGMALSLPVHAQIGAPVKNGETQVIVTGTRMPATTKVEMSDWRMAETPHVIVFSQGGEADLRKTAHDLEKLHFVISALFDRVGKPDETIKIAVTMTGSVAAFEQLQLTDLRWQYGPFSRAFAKTIYYDPRDEGPVLATTEDGVNLIVKPSEGAPTPRNCDGRNDPSLMDFISGGDLSDFLMRVRRNEIAFCQSAESRLYAGFVQNYLMTYFPAAYPRWFLQGFGEMFATMVTGDDYVEYGQVPAGFFQVIDWYGEYPIKQILDDSYLSGKGRPWTPFHAWRLSHLFYFSEEWKPRLEAYLKARASGRDAKSAARVLGSPAELQRTVTSYRGKKVQGERMTFPSDRAPAPTIRRLTRAEAGLIRGRLELGARVEVPEEGRERATALARRAAWLKRLRDNARQHPQQMEHHLLLAEAECRSGNGAECLSAADRVLAETPTDTRALVWKGDALTELAVRGPDAQRSKRLAEARRFIVRANRFDPESSLALLVYHDSFTAAGERAPDAAVDGLFQVVDAAPAAPGPRLKLGRELIRHNLEEEALKMLLPVARGPFHTSEQPAAVALLREGGQE